MCDCANIYILCMPGIFSPEQEHGRSHGRQIEERWKEGTRFGGGWEMVVEPSSLIGIIGGELVG